MSRIYTDFIHGVLLGVTSVTVTLPFGPCSQKVGETLMTFHNGVDMVPAVKVTPIEKAKVKEIGYNSTSGNYLVLQHGDDTESIFKHLVSGSILAKVGDIIERGPAVATSGRSGMVTGAHSHLEIRIKGIPVDPIPYLQGKKLITPYFDLTLDRPSLPVLRILIGDLYYRDKPNGNRIKVLEKKDYPYTGKSQLIGGHVWAEIVINDGTREYGYCAINPTWNTLIEPQPTVITQIKEVTRTFDQTFDLDESHTVLLSVKAKV